MGHDQDGAAEGFQRPFQDLAAGDIEVVGGLVQQQHVGPAQHQLQQLDPGPLAAGQGTDALIDIVPAEQEGAEVVA